MTMSNAAFETLEQRYSSSFTESWITNIHHYTPAFVIYQGDTLHQNTIDDSNVETIYQELIGEFPHEVHKKTRPYVEEVYIHVDDLESNEELAERVLEILKALDYYPIYDESHYSDLEHERIVEYVEDVLIWDIATNLDMISPAKIRRWVQANDMLLWDHFDGSIDDAPFNTEALTELVKEELAS